MAKILSNIIKSLTCSLIAVFIWGISPAMANNGEVKLCPFATGQKMPTNLLVGIWGKGLFTYSSKEGGRNVRLSDDIVSKKLWSGIFDTSRKFYVFPAERIKKI